MITHTPGMTIPDSRFEPFDTTQGGAITMQHDMQPRLAVDFRSERAMGGIFRQTGGSAEIIWPATEHGFVIEGEVHIHYHRHGKTVVYRPGDGWIIEKGDRVTWNVVSPTFTKSFFLLLD